MVPDEGPCWFFPACRQHHIDYDDGDQQDHVLGEEKYILLDPPKAAEKELPAEPANQNGKADAAQDSNEDAAQGDEGAAQGGDDAAGEAAASEGEALPAKRPRLEAPPEQVDQADEQQQPQQQGFQTPPALQQLQHRGNSAESPAHTGRKGSGDSFAAPGGSLATAPDTPAAAAAGAAGATPMLLRSSPMGPAAAAAAEAVVQLPAALAACCRRGSEMAAAAAAAGVTAILVGRFMAAFSCRMRWDGPQVALWPAHVVLTGGRAYGCQCRAIRMSALSAPGNPRGAAGS